MVLALMHTGQRRYPMLSECLLGFEMKAMVLYFGRSTEMILRKFQCNLFCAIVAASKLCKRARYGRAIMLLKSETQFTQSIAKLGTRKFQAFTAVRATIVYIRLRIMVLYCCPDPKRKLSA
jgi:hypothetical protein